jgi:hypothetical protein
VEPELAYGVLPHTHVEVGFPLIYQERAAGAGRALTALAGVEVSVLHNLNVETTTLPALGVALATVAPVGGLAPGQANLAVKGIATRTFRTARIHLNGEYTAGAAPRAGERGGIELTRWMAGVAVDRTFPLSSLLVTADVSASAPFVRACAGDCVDWRAGAGFRWQRAPRLALDAGVEHRFGGHDRGWALTLGAAYAFAVRSLIPVAR